LDGLKSTGEEQLKQKETAWDGHHGIKQDKSQKTGRSGDAALKPNAPTGTKKNGEVKVRQLQVTTVEIVGMKILGRRSPIPLRYGVGLILEKAFPWTRRVSVPNYLVALPQCYPESNCRPKISPVLGYGPKI